MKLLQLLPVDAVLSHLQARDKKHALKQIATHAATLTSIPEKEIFLALIEREDVGCTGMGSGVCIPHGRFNNLDTLHAIFARLETPIEFGAADGKKVDLIFVLLTPASANTEHLKALSLISKLLRDKKLCEKLRATEDTQALHSLLVADYNEEIFK